MSHRALVVILWLALFVALPVPYFVTEPGLVPPLRIAFLSGLMVAMAMEDGAGGAMRLFLLFLLVQTLGYGLGLWGAVVLTARWLRHHTSATFQRSFVWAVVGSLGVVAALGIYRTPLSSSGPYSSLARIFD